MPVENNGYTGIFESGSDTVIMRLSEAANLYDGSTGLTPGIALKFLVDGTSSQNLMAMESFVASNSWNFLGASLKNRVPQFDTSTAQGYIMDQTLRKKMTEGSQRPFGLAIGHIASILNDGTMLQRSETNSPVEIIFESPHADKISSEKQIDEAGEQVMWYDQLKKTLKSGDVIYDVLGKYEPDFPWERWNPKDKKVKIGELRLKTDLMTSSWADRSLYFQHRPINADHRMWPKWWGKYSTDVFFDKTIPENIFGDKTPKWPSKSA